jgi:hypothetical protein
LYILNCIYEPIKTGIIAFAQWHPWLSRWLLADSSSRPASSKPLKCSRSTRKRRRRCLFLRLASARHLPRLWSRVFKSPTFPLPATRATTSTRGSGARPPSPQPAATWLGFNFYKRPRTETASVSEALLLPVCVHPCVSNIQTTGCPSTAPPPPDAIRLSCRLNVGAHVHVQTHEYSPFLGVLFKI